MTRPVRLHRPIASRVAVLVLVALAAAGASCASGDAATPPVTRSMAGDSGGPPMTPGPASVGKPSTPAAGGEEAAAGGESRGELKALIGDAACQSDTQCRTVAVGWKSCGGPEAYLAWSTVRSDAAAIAAAGARSTEAAKRAARQSGVASTCSMVLDPGAACAPAAVASTSVATAAPRVCRLRASSGAGGAGVY